VECLVAPVPSVEARVEIKVDPDVPFVLMFAVESHDLQTRMSCEIGEVHDHDLNGLS
jgi:hypothetical protein